RRVLADGLAIVAPVTATRQTGAAVAAVTTRVRRTGATDVAARTGYASARDEFVGFPSGILAIVARRATSTNVEIKGLTGAATEGLLDECAATATGTAVAAGTTADEVDGDAGDFGRDGEGIGTGRCVV